MSEERWAAGLVGGVVEAEADSYFARLGYTVSMPTTPTWYDRVIEKGEVFQTVQCKTVHLEPGGRGSVNLLSGKRGGRNPRSAAGRIDWLFAMDARGQRYLIPGAEIVGVWSARIGPEWAVELPPMPTMAWRTAEEQATRCVRCRVILAADYARRSCEACLELTRERRRAWAREHPERVNKARTEKRRWRREQGPSA